MKDCVNYLILPSVGKWSIPTTTGPRPPPCSYFSFTAINGHQAVLFGGRQSDGRINDCYLIDFASMVSLEVQLCNNSLMEEHTSFTVFICIPGVDQTREVRRSPLAGREISPRCLLPQLWTRSPPGASQWRMG